MDHDSLGYVMEFGVGLAGISAIVTAFMHRSHALPALDRWRILNLLSLALTPPFFALLCIGLFRPLGSESTASRLSSGLLAIWLSALAIWTLRARGKLPRARAESIDPWVLLFMFLLTGVNIVAQAASAIYPTSLGFSVFYFGLVVVLFQGVVQFVRAFVGHRVGEAG